MNMFPSVAPSEPKVESDKSSADAPADSKSPQADKADDKNPGATPMAEKPAAAASKPARSAQDILTAPDVVFMFSFNDSDVKQTADTKCTAESQNDPQKQNACLAKARKAVGVDGYRFLEKDGKWWWLTLHTQGQAVHTLHKFEIEFGPEKDGSVEIKPKGKDLGTGHGRTPSAVTVRVPNEYQISINDPKLGKLVYQSKIGIMSK